MSSYTSTYLGDIFKLYTYERIQRLRKLCYSDTNQWDCRNPTPVGSCEVAFPVVNSGRSYVHSTRSQQPSSPTRSLLQPPGWQVVIPAHTGYQSLFRPCTFSSLGTQNWKYGWKPQWKRLNPTTAESISVQVFLTPQPVNFLWDSLPLWYIKFY